MGNKFQYLMDCLPEMLFNSLILYLDFTNSKSLTITMVDFS